MSRRRFNIDDTRYEVSIHALERYADRVRSITDPTFQELDAAFKEIRALITMDPRYSCEPPEWVGYAWSEEAMAGRSDDYMLVGDDLAFPIRYMDDGRWLVTTTLTRGTISPQQRKRRNDRKRKRREIAKERRQYEAWRGEGNSRWH
jgi:hypothetical protein